MNEQQTHEKIEQLDNLLVSFRDAQPSYPSIPKLNIAIVKMQSIISEMKKQSNYGKDND